MLNKEESSVCFQHNFQVPGYYDMLCHPNFFPIIKENANSLLNYQFFYKEKMLALKS
jgi:hypothetical protein